MRRESSASRGCPFASHADSLLPHQREGISKRTPLLPLAARVAAQLSQPAGGTYPDPMLDLSSLDLEEIADALADQTDYEHRWLITQRPERSRSGWLAPVSTGRHRSTPTSWIWSASTRCRPGSGTRTWPTSPTQSLMNAPGAGWHGPSRAKEPSAISRTSSTRSNQNWCRRGTPSATSAPSAVLFNGSPITC